MIDPNMDIIDEIKEDKWLEGSTFTMELFSVNL